MRRRIDSKKEGKGRQEKETWNRQAMERNEIRATFSVRGEKEKSGSQGMKEGMDRE